MIQPKPGAFAKSFIGFLSANVSNIISRISGTVYIISTILIIIRSTQPPENAAIEPYMDPITSTISDAKSPTISEILAPIITLMA